LLTEDSEFIVPKTNIAPWSELYRSYPKGHAGFLQWMQAFGKFFNLESIRCVEKEALDEQTTISEWKIIGTSFGAWDNEEISSVWKHTWVNGKCVKTQCCDVLDKLMCRSSPTHNLALFNKCFQAWGTGDIETMLNMTSDEYTYDCPISSVSPLNSVFKKYESTGKQALMDFLDGQKSSVEFKSCKPTQVAAIKDRVYVTWVTEEVWGGKVKVEGNNQWIWTFKNGQIFNIRDLTDLNHYESAFPVEDSKQ